MSTADYDILRRAEQLAPLRRLVEAVGTDFEPSVWLVGGAVRDLLLGRAVLDVDLMVGKTGAAVGDRGGDDGGGAESSGAGTNSLDGAFDAVAAALGVGPVRTHPAYLTATVGGYDLARPRVETYARPGALPTVRPADGVAEDLVRRDFSVNAMALGLTGEARGRLVGVPGAREDLSAGVLRVLHERSFLDDPTRLLRLARYAARLDFSIAAQTLDLAAAALAGGALETVSGTRIGNELRRIACEADPVRGFAALRELGIDAAVDPVLGLLDAAMARRALSLLEPTDRRDRVVLAAALLGASREAAAALLTRLGFVAEDRDVIAMTAATAERVSARLEFAGPPSAIDWAAGGPDGVAETVALAGAIHPANAARDWLVVLRHKRLSITGADLLGAGVPAGPAVGAGLAAARAALMDEYAPDADSQLEVALAAAASSPPGGAGSRG